MYCELSHCEEACEAFSQCTAEGPQLEQAVNRFDWKVDDFIDFNDNKTWECETFVFLYFNKQGTTNLLSDILKYHCGDDTGQI